MNFGQIHYLLGSSDLLINHSLQVTNLVMQGSAFLKKPLSEAEKNQALGTAMLHDIGNTVKFNPDHAFLFGVNRKDIKYWMMMSKKFSEYYGPTDLLANAAILKRIQAGNIIKNVEDKDSNEMLADPNNQIARLVNLADLLVSGGEVVGLQRRLLDVDRRYGRANEMSGFREFALQFYENMRMSFIGDQIPVFTQQLTRDLREHFLGQELKTTNTPQESTIPLQPERNTYRIEAPFQSFTKLERR